MLKQKTLAQPIKTVGIGLHSGRKSTLIIKPAPIDFGIQFVRVDMPNAAPIPAHALTVCDTRLASVILINAGLPIRRGLLSLIILMFMFVFTFASPFSSVSWGGFIPYFFILAIFLTSFKIEADKYGQSFDLLLIGILISINIFIFLIGFGTVLNVQLVIDLQSEFYQSIGDELFEHMVIWYSKPVTVFGSHSTAAFMYLVLFVVNLKLIEVIGVNTRLKILIAFCCV